MLKHPELLRLTPADGEEDPPDVLFGNRRKGYFKCKSLCRIWVLAVLKWLRSRGEYFVCWSTHSQNYDGRYTLAHAFTMKYVSLHEPGMSVAFDKNGALKSTSSFFCQVRRYMLAHICSLIYARSYMLAHICLLIYACSYMLALI